MNQTQKGLRIPNTTVGITEDGKLVVECRDEAEAIQIMEGISIEGEPNVWERQEKMLVMSPKKPKDIPLGKSEEEGRDL